MSDTEKSLNYDQASQQIRDAWAQAYPGDPPPWPQAVLNDAVVVSVDGCLYRVPYVCDETGVVFAERGVWVPVTVEYVPIEVAPIVEALADAVVIEPPPVDEIAVASLDTEDAAALIPEQDELAHLTSDTVKSLGSGKIGGYLVRFSTPDDPDLTGDFFTKDTDFGPHTTSLVYYQHAKDGTLKKRVLDPAAKLQKDDVGVWVEAQLQLRDDYERELEAMARAGKLGWSSGTAPHLVERVPMGKAVWIKSWPLGLDASLTPNPAEPRNTAVTPRVPYMSLNQQLDRLIEHATKIATGMGLTVSNHTEQVDV